MTVLGQIARHAATTVAVADDVDGLKAFRQPGCAAAIWRRQPDPAFQNWIDDLRPENLPHGRRILHCEGVRDAVTGLCDDANTPQCAERAALIDDVVALADIFADLMMVTHVRLRLEAVTTNACRKFHIDAITARLVCTYLGMGTQYGISRNGADPARIFTLQTGAPILLRGTLWPDPPAVNLLHRSPPIEDTGSTRLVLVLDPVFDPQDDE